MAKRRKLTAPSAEDLSKIEDEFRRETPARPSAMAPISQVAAETAEAVEVLGTETRTKLAEADAFKAAKEQGLLLLEIPLNEINADEIFRDRTVLIREELDELRDSIVTNGMRMPIEVFELPEREGGVRYGLISGYRRLMVLRELFEFSELEKYAKVRAIVRQPKTSADRFAAVVEENEVRASLSHFERGRFAALAASHGVFSGVEDAVENLFPFASKAKRSKVRSFALIFEDMGDMLRHAEGLTEKQGLRLAAALRGGAENDLRDALASAHAESTRDEWLMMEPVIEAYEDGARDPARGGRPSKAPKRQPGGTFTTSAGIQVAWSRDGKSGFNIHLKGRGIDTDLMEGLVAEIQHWLGRPDT
ncbi:MAG: ParB N-terminal domain-containing protein [Pseudomonadota bacterium]